ncbi:carboxylesterase family protein [Mitsuaria sp. GD03876]|uniref:carboxylesterase/lipase family protein n=1 Tax=Mitsuaria sp. GD03876 TaxID=2975399 RepID=UPI0024492625|nr:carboxylesterase family protein [Mitsuaria sp. GD03876]MDH0866504.1 carboxylesterase family protein [Mitsuaria sp. GD03876]
MNPILRSASTLTLVLSTLSLTACGGGSDGPPPPTQRTTAFGAVLGVDNSQSSGTYAWLGLPYAQPPVGALRWMPPVDPTAWPGTRAAQSFGHGCAQGGRYFSPAPNDAPYGLAVREGFGKPVGDEDCLTLNVWRPATGDEKLPVLFFIHGGSNISGYSADPVYNGQALAKKANAVVVTINYRVGILGWLDLPQLKTGDKLVDSGNFALLDQMQALKFVKNNIAAFGGDPGNVTIMGQSAGAVNVWNLLTSPQSAGLFHKAMPMSGGIVNATRATAQTYSRALLAAIVVADGKAADTTAAQAWIATQTDAQIAAYLRGQSAAQLLKVVLANPQLGNAPAPIEDGTVVPVNAAAALGAGQYQQVPVLAGNTRDEGTLFANLFGSVTGSGIPGFKLSDYDRFGLQFNFNPDGAATLAESDLINAAYLPVTAQPFGWNALSAFATNSIFVGPVTPQLAAIATKQPTKVWYYRFDWDEAPAPFNTVYGATHALDIPFVFGNFGANVFSFAYSTANKPGREALSDAMIASLSAFARTGDPNTPALGVTWKNYPAKLVLDASPTQLKVTAP